MSGRHDCSCTSKIVGAPSLEIADVVLTASASQVLEQHSNALQQVFVIAMQ